MTSWRFLRTMLLMEQNGTPKKRNPHGWPDWPGKPRWAWAFLDALAISPNVTQAAKLAHITRQKVYERRKTDEALARCWEQAIDESIEALEAEVHRRAFEGVEEAVWHQGIRVGTVRKYSDTLAIFLLKAHRPERYRERQEVKKIGTPDQVTEVQINVSMGVMMAERMADLSRIPPAPGLRPLGEGEEEKR